MTAKPPAPPVASTRPIPILALDVADMDAALRLLARLPRVEWVKVGLQLFTAAGPAGVRELRERGCHVFLDLKLHDIPNTVARAVEAAAELEAELLTLHASGGPAMMRAARAAADAAPGTAPRLLAVTVLTSLGGDELAQTWGRPPLQAEEEVIRLAMLAHQAGMDGLVASVRELAGIRARLASSMLVLTPGIRLSGDEAGDQTRIATPAEAARQGSDFLVIGRSVTAAADPAAAWDEVIRQIASIPTVREEL